MAKRLAVSKKTRFEVFKRDSFICQYCGKAAPSVILQVDHIHPVSGGGSNDILNLITACTDCNSGKSDRLLGDDAAVVKQINQTRLLSEKREQAKMLAAWRQSVVDLGDSELAMFEEFIVKNYAVCLSDFGRSKFKKEIKKWGLSEILEATEKSADRYLENSDSDEQQAKFLDYIPRICYWQKRERENPVEAELRKMAYTANRLWFNCNPHTLVHRLIQLHERDRVPKDVIFRMILNAKGIMRFEENMQEYFDNEAE